MMSGGYFNNYQYWPWCENMEEAELFKTLSKVFKSIDWAESGDTSREEAEKEIYDLMLSLGHRLFGGGD